MTDDVRWLTPEEQGDQYAGATRLGPGVWQDRHGDVHFSIPELLAHFELSPTPENEAAVLAILRDALPGVTRIIQRPR